MNTVLHILYAGNKETGISNLFKNKTSAGVENKQFVLTNCRHLNKNLFSVFEQIFYDKIDDRAKQNIFRFLKTMGYTHVSVCDSNKLYESIEYTELI